MPQIYEAAASSVSQFSVKKPVTFNKQVSAGSSGAGHELVLAPVSEVNVADG